MWIKSYQSLFLIVKIKKSGRLGFMIPVPIFVLDEILDSFEDLLWMVECIYPKWRIYVSQYNRRQTISPYKVIKECSRFFYELHRLGKWKLVEVDTDDMYISIDFM